MREFYAVRHAKAVTADGLVIIVTACKMGTAVTVNNCISDSPCIKKKQPTMALLHYSQIYISFLLENDSRLYGSTYSIAGMLDSYRVLVGGVTL